MPTPNVQPLLMPVLRAIAGGMEHGVVEIRERVKKEQRLTEEEVNQVHPKSGQNVYVNHVAFGLAYLNMGKAITKTKDGVYQIAERGRKFLDSGVDGITVNDARDAVNRKSLRLWKKESSAKANQR